MRISVLIFLILLALGNTQPSNTGSGGGGGPSSSGGGSSGGPGSTSGSGSPGTTSGSGNPGSTSGSGNPGSTSDSGNPGSTGGVIENSQSGEDSGCNDTLANTYRSCFDSECSSYLSACSETANCTFLAYAASEILSCGVTNQQLFDEYVSFCEYDYYDNEYHTTSDFCDSDARTYLECMLGNCGTYNVSKSKSLYATWEGSFTVEMTSVSEHDYDYFCSNDNWDAPLASIFPGSDISVSITCDNSTDGDSGRRRNLLQAPSNSGPGGSNNNTGGSGGPSSSGSSGGPSSSGSSGGPSNTDQSNASVEGKFYVAVIANFYDSSSFTAVSTKFLSLASTIQSNVDSGVTITITSSSLICWTSDSKCTSLQSTVESAYGSNSNGTSTGSTTVGTASNNANMITVLIGCIITFGILLVTV